MSYETRAYDNKHGNPVVVLVATGTHDVSRLVALLKSGNCEQVDLGAKVLRQVRNHNGGRAALQLLAAHGGPDFLHEPVAPHPWQEFNKHGLSCHFPGCTLAEIEHDTDGGVV
ncbi:hypothetical protein OHA21_43665 [Actinoplanes sp. NBC_00393]|uniref:hypothetical protein n=1 Tax=Actinoplanes sp. NBC_00393 TaxID=2975953 RepID=UPI002E1B5642